LADRLVEGTCHLVHDGVPCLGEAQGDQCDKCSNMMNALELIDPKCKVCKAVPEIRSSENIFIDLPKITPDLKKWVDRQ
jgi:methionyl-tRNA synthetase